MLSLRNKIYFILLGTTTLFFGLAYGFVWFTSEKEIALLQRVHAEEELNLVERILNREMDNLVSKQADWARWDDTYEFVTDRNEAYITSNLGDESLKVLGINIMAFVNNSGELVYGKQVQSTDEDSSVIPETFKSYFRSAGGLLDFSDLTSAHKGILTIPDAMLLVASQPITTSDGLGSRRGTIIFARYIDEEYGRMLAELSGVKVGLANYGFANVGTEGEEIVLRSDARSLIEMTSDRVIGKRLIDNIFGNPSLLLQVEYPAQLVIQGRSFLLQGLGYSFFALITYISLITVIIDVFLLRRVENMRQIARKVSVLHSGTLPEGDIDDFSHLATIMMDAIKSTKKSDTIITGNQKELMKFKIALDQSFDHTMITDAEGKILYANVAATELTGYSLQEMIGKTPSLWGKQMPVEFYRKFWDTIRLKKEIFEGEVTNRHKNGKRYKAYLRVAPILDEKKQVLYFIGIERALGTV